MKEVLSKQIRGDKTTFSVTLGVKDSLQTAPLSVFKDGVCVSVADASYGYDSEAAYLLELKKTNTPIYYSLDNIVYFCVVTMTIVDNVVVKKAVAIYCPIDHVTVVQTFTDRRPPKQEVKEIVCKNITTNFSVALRDGLVNSLSEFVLFRAM